MSDSSSTNPVRDSEPRDAAEREARIEELLLSGLDHYFASQYERAINVWTRIVFLDRHHDRAHAYIERARSALAERQRQSEELLHTGVAAYHAGDVDKARELLTRAVEQGSDSAHLFLDRLNRVTTPGVAADLRLEPRPPRVERKRRVPLTPPRRGWTAAALGAFVVATAMLLGGLPIGTWLSELQGGTPVRTAQPVVEEPLPVVRAAETALLRARSLYADGRIRDALRVLDRINPSDPARGEADQLRADIQRDLLAAAGLSSAAPVEAGQP
ncbi:MAG: tetratricopeptide repeat protein [Acidobacteria bacterium]|nr:tetratricopeptide repeat protein [Acidobacteriota bacterium]